MIEIYLFVHPFSTKCYDQELRIIDFIHEQPLKIDLQILPLVNWSSNRQAMMEHGWDKKVLTARNKFNNLAYLAALDYKTIQLQGKKVARRFLIAMQTALFHQRREYSPQLTAELIQKIGGDLAIFNEDRPSDLIDELFWQDQKIARELGVQQKTSAVVYNFYKKEEFGTLLHGAEALDTINSLCQANSETYIQINNTYLKQAGKKLLHHTPKLTLL